VARKCGKKLKDVLYFSNKLLRVRPHDSVYCAQEVRIEQNVVGVTVADDRVRPPFARLDVRVDPSRDGRAVAA